MREKTKAAKYLKTFGVCLAIWGFTKTIWDAIGHIGNAQTLWEMISAAVQYWPNFLRGTVWVATSWWFALIASMLCLCLWWFLSKRTGSSFAGVTFGDAVFFSSERDDGTQLLRCMEKPTTAHFSGIKIAYDKDGTDCMWPTTFQRKHQNEVRGMVARLRVDSETKSNISECKAAITSLGANQRTLMSGVQLPLLFTPSQSPGSDTKAIRCGQSEYLELLWIPSSGEAEIMTSFPFAFTEYKTLNRLSAYSLHIAFSVDNVITTAIVDAAYTSRVWMLSIRPPSRSAPNTEASQHSPTS